MRKSNEERIRLNAQNKKNAPNAKMKGGTSSRRMYESRIESRTRPTRALLLPVAQGREFLEELAFFVVQGLRELPISRTY